MGKQGTAWMIKEGENMECSPAEVQEMIIACFHNAFENTQQMEKKDDLHGAGVQNEVKVAFLETYGNFDRPSKQNIIDIIAYLQQDANPTGYTGKQIAACCRQLRQIVKKMEEREYFDILF